MSDDQDPKPADLATTDKKLPLRLQRDPLSDRIMREIMDMMVDGTWNGGKSARQFAEAYGRSSTAIANLATQAGCYLDGFMMSGSTPEERQASRAVFLSKLTNIREAALNREALHFVAGQAEPIKAKSPDFSAAVRAMELEAKTRGLMQPELHELRIGRLSEVSDAELLAKLDRLRAMHADDGQADGIAVRDDGEDEERH